MKIQFARLECKKCHNILHKRGNFKMQRRNLAKKITINTMKIENSANYFAGLQIASAMGKNEFPRKKNVPEDLLPSVK